MTTTALTPYDTGERLEPQSWSLDDPDSYGLVDLDDDEGATVFTLVGKRHDDEKPGYLLSISTYTDDSTVEVDGDRVLVLNEQTAADLQELVDFAHRGWDDFLYQAANTHDYTDEDIASTTQRWRCALRAIEKIQGDKP